MTSAASTVAGALTTATAASVSVPGGIQVTGARCDAKGRIVNRTGLTLGGADDGSQVVGAAGVRQVGGDGSGQVVGAAVTYSVRKDGSGQIVTPTATVTVEADGSGQYVGRGITYQVNKDGSGQYVAGSQSLTVNADGSGQWVSEEYGTVVNNGDGSGDWTGPDSVVHDNGDGTGTVNGSPTPMDPLPAVARLGTFPKLATLKAQGKPCGVLIRISAGVLFDFDSAELRPAAGPVLESVATALRNAPGRVSVNGHTDAKGDDAYNLTLSRRRASAVMSALREAGLGVPVTAHGFGEAQPVAPNTLKGADNPAGRQLNRRVEIVLTTS